MDATLYVSLGCMLIFGVTAVMLHSMLKSSIALAVSSIALGIVMYSLGAVTAALFEISVCSGLVTVIFVCAISLSNIEKKDLGAVFKDKQRMAPLPVLLIAAGVVLILLALATGFSLPLAEIAAGVESSFRDVLWNQRQADIWGQIIVALTGAFAIVVLFRERA